MDIKKGLKLRSSEISYHQEIENLFNENKIDYIELYIIPHTFLTTSHIWKSLSVPFIIHAPHTAHNTNLALASLRKSNFQIYSEVKRFADLLNSPIIIFHSGCNGTFEEVIFQIKKINDTRMHVENKPLVGLNGEHCWGTSQKEIVTIEKECDLKGYVLDIGHAIYFSNSICVNWMNQIKQFIQLEPKMYHLSDGEISSEKDMHLNFGKGNFPLHELINLFPNGTQVTLETPRSNESLSEFIEDLNFLKNITHKRQSRSNNEN
jgi:deoxyribonuclease IV